MGENIKNNNKKTLKKWIILIILLMGLALIIPIPNHLNEEGIVEYGALTYKITKLNKSSQTSYDDGIKIEILGIQIYNNLNEYSTTVKANEIKNVSISIKEGSLTNTSATIVIVDTNIEKHTYGEDYRIERKVDNKWEELEKIDNNYTFVSLGKITREDNTITFNVNWEKLYGNLEQGQYRLIKSVDEKRFSAIEVQFEIK